MRVGGYFQGVPLHRAPPIKDEGTPNHFENLTPMLILHHASRMGTLASEIFNAITGRINYLLSTYLPPWTHEKWANHSHWVSAQVKGLWSQQIYRTSSIALPNQAPRDD